MKSSCTALALSVPLLLTLQLWLLCLCGATHTHVPDALGWILSPPSTPVESSLWGLPQSPLACAYTVPDWAQSCPKECSGQMGEWLYQSRLPNPSLLFSIGQYLEVEEDSGVLEFTLRMPSPRGFTSRTGLDRLPGFITRSWLTCVRAANHLPSLFLKGCGVVILRLARIAEGEVFLWASSLAVLLWQCLLQAKLRTISWLGAASVAWFLWESKTVRTLVKVLLLPLWVHYQLTLLAPRALIFLAVALRNLSLKSLAYSTRWLNSRPREKKRSGVTLRARKTLRKRNTKERALKGFDPTFIASDPPKSVIGYMLEEGDQIGYCSAVKLQSGERALMTAWHVWKHATSVRGPSGNKLSTGEFELLAYSQSKQLDFVLAKGPSSWESVLGFKARPLLPVTSLSKGRCVFFTQHQRDASRDSGKWWAHAANVLEFDGDDVLIECVSHPGDSGLPVFSQQGTKITTMLLGSRQGQEVNRAAAIPPIPGLTVPDSKVFKTIESLYVANRVVDIEEDLDDPVREFDLVVGGKALAIKSRKGGITIASLRDEAFQPKGKIWADWAEEPDSEYECDRPGNGQPQITPLGKQKGTACPPPAEQGMPAKAEEAASTSSLEKQEATPPPPAPRRAPKTKEQKAEQRKAYRERRKARRGSPSATKPKVPASLEENIVKAVDFDKLARKVEEAVLARMAASKVQPPLRRPLQASTGGGNLNLRPQALSLSAPAPSQRTNALQALSQAGDSKRSSSPISWVAAAKSTAGPRPVPKQN